MSQPINLEILKQHQRELLLAEVAAWLHMFGKFHEDFLNGNHSLDNSIPPDLEQDQPSLASLLKGTWSGAIWDQLGTQELQAAYLSILSLIEQHRVPNAPVGLQRLMQDAHGRSSGTEKGALERFFPGQTGAVFLSTALGYEPDKPINLKTVKEKRKDLYAFLQKSLAELRSSDGRVDWHTFRQNFISKIKTAFQTSVAETRRPINDVTLFDQTFASVAFFKAALAQILLLGWHEPNQLDVTKKYHWRILRVGIDGLQFWGQAIRLNDMLSRKARLEEALNQVQTLLEETYPLGMETYRDENGGLFVMPDAALLLDYQANGLTLREQLQEIAKTTLAMEAAFDLELSAPTRNMLSFGKLATKALFPPSPSPDWIPDLEKAWNTVQKQDICPVCGLRPQGPDSKSRKRKVCQICEQRRSDRSKAWVYDMNTPKMSTTIWTNEAADTNGNIALITGRFGIETWLTGANSNSISAFGPHTRKIQYERRGNAVGPHLFSYQKFLEEIQQLLTSNVQIGANTTPLLNFLLPERYQRIGQTFSETYDFYLQDSDLAQPQRKPHRFALALMRQNPSPARLRRIWETTRTFWQEVQTLALERLSDDRRRLKIYLTDEPDLGFYHVYDLQLGEAELDVVWVPPQNGQAGYLLTADNLGYIAHRLQPEKDIYTHPAAATIFVENYIKNHFITRQQQPVLYNPDVSTDEHRKNLLEGIFFRELSYQENRYATAIPILAEPRSFMMIVPADKALEIVNCIHQKYEREMGKVRNRLPLFLSLVFFERKIPLLAVLDAGRAMLNRTTDAEQWTVTAKTDCDHLDDGKPRRVHLTLARDGHEIRLEVPTVMGDGATFDPWYPYWRVEGKPTDRQYWFIGPDGEHWVHIKDLQPGDAVRFTPATLDFICLDSAARRFDVAYNEQGHRLDRPSRPWILEEFAVLETLWDEHITRLRKTQIKQILQTIESARARWLGSGQEGKSVTDETFRQFVADTLANANWLKDRPWNNIPQPKREALINATVHGELADLEELHFGILKESL